MFKGAEMSMYWWVHEHYRLCTLPWDSIWTWLAAFIAADFIHYVGHRAAHGKVSESVEAGLYVAPSTFRSQHTLGSASDAS